LPDGEDESWLAAFLSSGKNLTPRNTENE